LDPLSNNLVSRGVILEMATGGVVEKGASFRAFYPDIDDGILVPDLLNSDSSPSNNVLRRFKQENLIVSTDLSIPPAGTTDNLSKLFKISLTVVSIVFVSILLSCPSLNLEAPLTIQYIRFSIDHTGEL